MPIVASFSEEFCLSLMTSIDKKVNKACKQLCRESPELENLHAQFNAASGINSTHLEQFIAKEAEYFTKWCQELTDKRKEFSIEEYIHMRKSSTKH